MLKRLVYLSVVIAVHLTYGITWTALFYFSALLLSLVYIVFPLVFRHVAAVSRNLVFVPFIHWPSEKVDDPLQAGLVHARNFYLNTDDGVKLGVWHVLPEPAAAGRHDNADNSSDDYDDMEQHEQHGDGEYYERQLRAGAPVVLYNHGNSGSRAGPHRVELYRLLAGLGYHVIAFDYRGYADSSAVSPSETGVVADSRFMYKWLRQRVGDSALIVWGHSLGTGVTCRMVADLCDEGDCPSGLVLESPFNNLRDEVASHSLSLFYRKMPGFEWLILESLKKFDLNFDSDRHIGRVTVPTLIMHAHDDLIIPHRLAVKLYEAALKHHDPERVQFHSFDAHQGYGHKYICRSPRLPHIFKQFVQRVSAAK